MKKEISSELIEKTRKWLGKDGIAFFNEMKEKHGKYDAMFMEGSIPHPVHFREGMQVRNFMRQSGLCEDWDDHDFDDSWVELITKVIDGIETVTELVWEDDEQ